MTTDAALNEKREELKRRLAAGEYRTLIDVVLDGTERIIRKITRGSRPIYPWYSVTILYLVIVLVGFSGEIPNVIRMMASLPIGIFVLMFAAGYFAVASMAAGNFYVHRVFTTFCDNVLDAAATMATVEDFEHWLTAVCNWRGHLIFSIVGGVLAGIYLSFIMSALGLFGSLGFILMSILLGVCSTAFLYLLFYMVALSVRIGRYHLRLYAADPSSSEVIGRLSGILSTFVYLLAIYGAFLTLSGAFFGLLSQALILVAPLLWIPVVAMFILNQTSLSSIIRRAKWKTLNEIQARVETLHTADSLAEKDTMDAINRLMDYHDRIKGTRNSAFDLRAVLSLINSLLLPFLALLLANLDRVLALFQ